jgi:hypothetical protein
MSNVAKNPVNRTGVSKAADRSGAEPSTEFFVVDTKGSGRKGNDFSYFKRHLPSNVRRLNTDEDIVNTFLSAGRHSVWFAPNDSFVFHLAKAVHEPKGDHRLFVFDEPTPLYWDLTNVYFRFVVPASAGFAVLPPQELTDVLTADNREDLLVGGLVREDEGLLILFRGDLGPLVVPLSWFVGGKRSPAPDFGSLSIQDYGHTVRFGDFEAATDAILYEFDPDFRRRARQNQLAADPSFGGSLRRLRIQKGVSREDFPGVSPKTIARIERNEVDDPRPKTLQAIAKRLGVPEGELGTY